LQLKMH